MNVGVIGLGYVGLTLSIVAAKSGFKVFGIDNDQSILEAIKERGGHFYEKNLSRSTLKVINKSFFISKKFSADNNIDCFIITVGTPLNPGSKEPNIEHIKKALDSISHIYNGKQLIILRSTVSVGTTRNVVISKLSEMSNIKKDEILISFCPERTIEGNALNELVEIPQIIGSNNQKSQDAAENFFRKITPTILKVESLEAAELIKLFNNTYRDIHFSIGNYFNNIAQSFGISGENLIKIANYNYKRSQIAKPGLVGGPCLEKDSYILVHNMKDSEGKNFVLGARIYNEAMEDRIIKWIKMRMKKHLIKNIGISGLAFKGRPDNSDLRGSSAVNIIRKLKLNGIDVTTHDFIARGHSLKDGYDIENNFNKFIVGLEMLIILNDNKRYLSLDINMIEKNMDAPYLIFDCWSALAIDNMDNKLNLVTIGNMELNK